MLVTALGGLLMLGRYTILFDGLYRVPVLGSGRIPVRYHLWVAMAVAALAATGVDWLARPGTVRLWWAVGVVGLMALVSVPILIDAYRPIWTEAHRWVTRYHEARFRWLGEELSWAVGRTVLLGLGGGIAAAEAARARSPGRRAGLAAVLPVLVGLDLLSVHAHDAPTVSPTYWTEPPPSTRRLRADPRLERVFGLNVRSAGEPGYASKRVDFF